jgi:serine/threonine protein phosphatase PrpC
MMQKSEPAKNEQELAKRLEAAIAEAGRRILTAAKLNRAQRGMGTTVTAATLIGPRLLVGQVGDSRAYILRGRQFVQITKDQSLVQQLIDANQMTEEEARTFDKNNIILQALGTAEEVHVDVTSVVLKRGDSLLMCSDGLSGIVENDAIRDVLLENPDQIEACRILTDKACEGGGHDNITVILATFDGDGLAPPPVGKKVDKTLVYERYDFSHMTENTSRTSRPKPFESDTEDTPPKGVEVESAEDVEAPGETERGFPLVGAVAALLLMIIAAIGYLMLEMEPSATGENAADPQGAAPAAVPPVAVPAVKASPSVPGPLPAQPVAPPSEEVAAPQLTPIARESITGNADGDGPNEAPVEREDGESASVQRNPRLEKGDDEERRRERRRRKERETSEADRAKTDREKEGGEGKGSEEEDRAAKEEDATPPPDDASGEETPSTPDDQAKDESPEGAKEPETGAAPGTEDKEPEGEADRIDDSPYRRE